MAIRNVISTLGNDGRDMMGPGVLIFRFPSSDVQNGSLLTVESNHFAVLKSRGAILDVYETGQYPVATPQRAIIGTFQQAFYGGQSPWQYEVIYINRAKVVVSASGTAYSREMAELAYSVDYYVHVDTKEDAVKLVQHMPVEGWTLTREALNAYAGPVVEQAVNQVVQVTALDSVNERIHDISDLVTGHLQDFLSIFGITLNQVKVIVAPRDNLIRQLISLRAFGLGDEAAVRYYIAMRMAERGLVSAPNMACGAPFNIGGTLPTLPLEAVGGSLTGPVAAPGGDGPGSGAGGVG